ncbi:hypothetical protein [Elizabethkingia anophelis]|uniref:hypothetical protein n=1 Tax=Elizabethkingia anophelis TaxID=1117645 RepID=UPI0024E1DB1B|nr:hypothetical protein [Elizabethkingia anophelis]CAH1143342.1 hypothetical protein EAVNVB490_01346 [Elizabethkingia anophelis]CAI9670272.1 hypothetical protein EAVNNN508_01345 [Elizabethkingia anophelis]CAI9673452.1 hypothetical protein EAVNVB490_00817 [Elizabethkingia anophelis]CAI9678871.1 hypothetical protein EAVNNN508_00815 [Elizabethkingia anophelis]
MYKILLSIGIVISSISLAQSVEYGKYNIKLVNTELNELAKETNGIKIYYTPTDFLWSIKIENNSGESVQIDWDKSTFVIDKRASGIVFNDSSRLTANLSKGKETIPNGTILTKKIYPKRNVEYMSPTLTKYEIKKFGKSDIDINLNFSRLQDEFEVNGKFEATLKK